MILYMRKNDVHIFFTTVGMSVAIGLRLKLVRTPLNNLLRGF